MSRAEPAPVAPRAELKVLLTGIGAPGTRGTLYALAHNPDEVRVRAVGVDAQPAPVGCHWFERFRQVPLPADPAYPDTLLAFCRAEAVELIIPQTTRETAALAALKGRFARHGVRVMVADPDAVARANHKGALLELFARLGLAHPAYRLARDADELRRAAAALGYPHRPVVVKPPVSNGSRGFRVLREAAWDATRFLAEKPNGVDLALDELLAVLGHGGPWPELLVCEHLPGAEYSVDAFAGKNGAVAVPRLRRVVRGGISFETVLEPRADLAEATLRAAAALGLTGAFGFQFKLDADGVPKVLECNPRVQGTMVAAVFGGVNVIWLAVQEALGTAPVPPAAARPACFQRFWGGLGVRDGSVDEI